MQNPNPLTTNSIPLLVCKMQYQLLIAHVIRYLEIATSFRERKQAYTLTGPMLHPSNNNSKTVST